MSAETPERLIQRVARRIVELRRASGLTQEVFAERLDVTVQYVSKIEVGENLTLRSIATIARVLGVAVGALFESPSPQPASGSRRGPGRPRQSNPKR